MCLPSEKVSTEIDQSLVKEGVSVSSPLLVQGWKRPLFCSVPCMPTSHSITSVCGAAVEPLSTLGSGGCLQDGDSSQALDGRSFYEREKCRSVVGTDCFLSPGNSPAVSRCWIQSVLAVE